MLQDEKAGIIGGMTSGDAFVIAFGVMLGTVPLLAGIVGAALLRTGHPRMAFPAFVIAICGAIVIGSIAVEEDPARSRYSPETEKLLEKYAPVGR